MRIRANKCVFHICVLVLLLFHSNIFHISPSQEETCAHFQVAADVPSNYRRKSRHEVDLKSQASA